MTTQDAACKYLVRYGWFSVPVPYQCKGPVLKGWQKLRITEEDIPRYFDGQPQNIGVLLGPVSGNLYDVDLDCAEALRLAPGFLPATLTFGRKSTPKSHWLYTANQEIHTKKYVLGQDTLVELRGTSSKGTPHQTVFPPSVHESGERIRFDSRRRPEHVDAEDLQRWVQRLAAACLFVRGWPTTSGTRHERAMALSGALLRAGWSVEDVEHLVEAVATAAGDEEVEDRVRVVRDTQDALDADGEATGWPRLTELFREETVKARKWLGIKGGNTSRSKKHRTKTEKQRKPERPSVLDVLAEMGPIPEAVFDSLPGLLKVGLPLFEDRRERDVFVTGALGVLSGCLPNVWGRYDASLFAPNLYLHHRPAGKRQGSVGLGAQAGQKSTCRDQAQECRRHRVLGVCR